MIAVVDCRLVRGKSAVSIFDTILSYLVFSLYNFGSNPVLGSILFSAHCTRTINTWSSTPYSSSVAFFIQNLLCRYEKNPLGKLFFQSYCWVYTIPSERCFVRESVPAASEYDFQMSWSGASSPGYTFRFSPTFHLKNFAKNGHVSSYTTSRILFCWKIVFSCRIFKRRLMMLSESFFLNSRV